MLEQFWSLRSKDKRLVQKYGSLILVIAKVSKVAYKIAPPNWIKVHPMIHVSNLKAYHLNNEDPSCNQPTRPEVNLNQPKNKAAEEILPKKELIVRRYKRQELLVKWKGLGDEETNKEKEEDLSEFKELIKAF